MIEVEVKRTIFVVSIFYLVGSIFLGIFTDFKFALFWSLGGILIVLVFISLWEVSMRIFKDKECVKQGVSEQ